MPRCNFPGALRAIRSSIFVFLWAGTRALVIAARCARPPVGEASTPVSQDRSDMRNSFFLPRCVRPLLPSMASKTRGKRPLAPPSSSPTSPDLTPHIELLGSARPPRPPLNPTAQFLRLLFGALLTIRLTFSPTPTTGDRNRARAAMAGKSSLLRSHHPRRRRLRRTQNAVVTSFVPSGASALSLFPRGKVVCSVHFQSLCAPQSRRARQRQQAGYARRLICEPFL